MAARKRSRIQQERDRAIISEFYLKGWSQAKIGEYLELNQSQISRELAKIKAQWKAESVRDYDLHVDEQLRRLGMIESETWEAWQRSQQPKEQSLQEKLSEVAASGDSRTKVQRKTEARIGDPRFLEALLKSHQERSKLLDLYPASSRDFNNATTSGRSSGAGLSGDTVDLIRASILGVTQSDGQPNEAGQDFTHPAVLPAEVASGQAPSQGY